MLKRILFTGLLGALFSAGTLLAMHVWSDLARPVRISVDVAGWINDSEWKWDARPSSEPAVAPVLANRAKEKRRRIQVVKDQIQVRRSASVSNPGSEKEQLPVNAALEPTKNAQQEDILLLYERLRVGFHLAVVSIQISPKPNTVAMATETKGEAEPVRPRATIPPRQSVSTQVTAPQLKASSKERKQTERSLAATLPDWKRIETDPIVEPVTIENFPEPITNQIKPPIFSQALLADAKTAAAEEGIKKEDVAHKNDAEPVIQIRLSDFAPVGSSLRPGDQPAIAHTQPQTASAPNPENSVEAASRVAKPKKETGGVSSASVSIPAHVEAFDWVREVPQVSTQVLSRDNTPAGMRRWILSQASGYMPTMAWVGEEILGIPMMGENTLRILEKVAGEPQRSEAGLILGKLPGGWSIAPSRTDVLYLDHDGLPVEPEADQSGRYFIILNQPVGSQFLRIVHRASNADGGFTVPVDLETVTYLDWSDLDVRDLKGRVYDSQGRGMKGVYLQFAMDSGNRYLVSTGQRGEFRILGVPFLSDYPVYLDTVTSREFIHRHTVYSMNEEIPLFRFDRNQVTAWLEQISGGLSDQSGLVVGSVKHLFQASGYSRLTPKLDTPASRAFTLSPSGELLEDTPIETTVPVFLLTEVGPGFHQLSLQDTESAAKAWWGSVYSAPGVINVVNADATGR